MITAVSIRLIASSEAEAQAAITELRNYVGSARIALSKPERGRKGDQWLSYGMFQFDRDEPTTIVAPAPATGKTRKLRGA
jgi:hypothetical protein